MYVLSSPRDAAMIVVLDPVSVCTVKSQGCRYGSGIGSCRCVVSSPRDAAMVVVFDPVGVCTVKSQGCLSQFRNYQGSVLQLLFVLEYLSYIM